MSWLVRLLRFPPANAGLAVEPHGKRSELQPDAQPSENSPGGLTGRAEPDNTARLVPASAARTAEPTLVTVGDIAVSQHWVTTPAGVARLGDVTWTATPMYQTTEGIPTWAIVCAIVFFVFCLLGLLFLLVKEKKTAGHVQVTVQGLRLFHTCYIPVSSPEQASM